MDAFTYKKRSVGNYYSPDMKKRVSTAFVSDGIKPYETYVDLDINVEEWEAGDSAVVEVYETIEQATEGHEKWVRLLKEDKINKPLEEVNNSKYFDDLTGLVDYSKELTAMNNLLENFSLEELDEIFNKKEDQ